LVCAPPKVHDPAKIRKNREFSHTTVNNKVFVFGYKRRSTRNISV